MRKTQILLLPLLLLLLLLLSFSYTGKGKKPNRTIRDSVFAVGDIIRIPEVRFLPSPDYGKMNTNTKDSLDVVAEFMRLHPTLSVELVNHTDYLGSYRYNNLLSQERSKACVKYLTVEKHVDPKRIRAKAAGEYFLLYDESDIEKANSKEEKEAMHQANFRTELLVRMVW